MPNKKQRPSKKEVKQNNISQPKIEKLERSFNNKIDKIQVDITDRIEKVDTKVENSQLRINELDKKIIEIQKSTKTLFKIFSKPHNWLRGKSRLYYKWHTNPYADTTHWVILIIAFLISLFLVGYQFGFFGGAKPSSQAAPGIPKMINYQGKLTDLSNFPVADGTYYMNIRIFDSETGGNCLWAWKGSCSSPVQVPVTVTNGNFSVMLGDTAYQSTNPLTIDFNSDSLFLSVQVDSDPEMTPRKRIGAVGYAYNSDAVDGKHETDFALLAGRSGGQTLVGGTAANEDLILEGTSDSTKNSSYVNIQPSGGNVGIGTANPGSTLTVRRATAGTSLSVRDTTDTIDKFTVTDTGLVTTADNLVFSGVNPSIAASLANTSLSIDANGTGVINIGSTSTGNVHLAGGSGATGCTVDNTTGSFSCSGSFSGSSIALSSLVQGSVVYVGSGGTLTGDANNFIWNPSSKRLAIGKNTPNQVLEVASSGAADTQLSIINTNAGDYNPQLGFQLMDGINNYTVGVHDSDNDKFKICTTALGVNCAFIMDSEGNLTIGISGKTLIINGNIENSSTPGVYSGLIIKENATNPAYQVDISAAALSLWDWTDLKTREWRNVSETVSLHASGVNGLDTGTETPNTWYYLWMIGKADGTIDGLISASPTSPTMPSGYIYRIRLGSIYNDSASNIMYFTYSDGWFQWRTTVTALAGGAALAPTAINLSNSIPPISKVVTVMAGIYATNNTFVEGYINASNSANGSNSQIWGKGNNNYQWNGQGQIILETSQVIYYYLQTVPPNNPGRMNVYIVSYQDIPVIL